jgi:hypothetical protein
MTGSYKEIVAQIEGLNEEISRWTSFYQDAREKLDLADREVMALHKKKWQLEMLLTPVIKLAPSSKILKQAKLARVKKDLKIEDMSESEILMLLEMIQAMKEGEENGDASD